MNTGVWSPTKNANGLLTQSGDFHLKNIKSSSPKGQNLALPACAQLLGPKTIILAPLAPFAG